MRSDLRLYLAHRYQPVSIRVKLCKLLLVFMQEHLDAVLQHLEACFVLLQVISGMGSRELIDECCLSIVELAVVLQGLNI
jgi:hypothetical protein